MIFGLLYWFLLWEPSDSGVHDSSAWVDKLDQVEMTLSRLPRNTSSVLSSPTPYSPPLRAPFVLYPSLLSACFQCFLSRENGEYGTAFFVSPWFLNGTLRPSDCLRPRDYPISDMEGQPFHYVCPVDHPKREQIVEHCFDSFYLFSHTAADLSCGDDETRLKPQRLMIKHHEKVNAGSVGGSSG